MVILLQPIEEVVRVSNRSGHWKAGVALHSRFLGCQLAITPE